MIKNCMQLTQGHKTERVLLSNYFQMYYTLYIWHFILLCFKLNLLQIYAIRFFDFYFIYTRNFIFCTLL